MPNTRVSVRQPKMATTIGARRWLFFLNLNLYPARVQQGTEADTSRSPGGYLFMPKPSSKVARSLAQVPVSKNRRTCHWQGVEIWCE